MPVWHGSGHELGILDAVMLHSCAAANCTLPSDILSYERVDDVIVKPIDIRESYAYPSGRPGLGIELDQDAVRTVRREAVLAAMDRRTFLSTGAAPHRALADVRVESDAAVESVWKNGSK